ITKDSLGLESLVKKVHLVTLSFKEIRQIQFNSENKSLIIVLNSKSGRNGYFTSQEILSELNKSL
ncbi:MAG: hypothetical protein NT027_16100, partial [Proteobacteria bacterium]|nr:hypothetical protein [Pseudomonadota bacterium]